MRCILVVFLLLFSFSFSGEFLVLSEKNGIPVIKKVRQSMLTGINEDYIYIEPIYTVRKTADPNDPFYRDSLLNPQWWWLTVNAPQSWDLIPSNTTVYVAVLDTGVDYTHPDLKDNLWVNQGEISGTDTDNNGIDDGCENNSDDDNNGYIDDCYGINAICYNYDGNGDIVYNPNNAGCNRPDAFDEDGHGTHVSGIIGAVTDNGIGVPGILWNRVKIVPCKFLDGNGNGTTEGEFICLDYIRSLISSGLDIIAINASYGGYYYSNIEKTKIAQLSNTVFVSAAGNNGDNVDVIDFSPCVYDLPNQICVGASDKNNRRAEFTTYLSSNYGFKNVKIFAPGLDIQSTYLGSGFAYASGTSQATPFVTGAVGLLYIYDSGMTVSQIKERIIYSGSNYPENLSGESFSCNVLNLYSMLVPDNNQKICLDRLSYNFGQVNVGEKSSVSFTVRSAGLQPLSIISVNSFLPQFTVSENCTGNTINSGNTCSIDVSFIPDKAGDFTGGIIINYGNNNSVEIAVQGEGVLVNNPVPSSSDSSGGGGCSTGSVSGFQIYLIVIAVFIIRYMIGRYGSIS
ncbi:Serine protease, subtilisin family [Persephonella hydrogeniphila]|uniref:Serine protease, subtilisin family n=1 Tax=Persephonella hydrogeniphila TaxID=198703 RepID=A0A285NAG4_9AQUI|nr:S8 family serine peptidase [Persephonella hydrogeniphila]SNZ06462.1 Serine protease, subtilisin family [Persephonella hydrogeniphila]